MQQILCTAMNALFWCMIGFRSADDISLRWKGEPIWFPTSITGNAERHGYIPFMNVRAWAMLYPYISHSFDQNCCESCSALLALCPLIVLQLTGGLTTLMDQMTGNIYTRQEQSDFRSIWLSVESEGLISFLIGASMYYKKNQAK